VLYGFFGAVLLGGLSVNRLFIKYVFAQAFELDEPGWKKLTIRWGLFFLCLAVINESVWRSTSTATWVSFKYGHHPPDLPLRARTDPAGDKASDKCGRRQKGARMMRPWHRTRRVRTIFL